MLFSTSTPHFSSLFSRQLYACSVKVGEMKTLFEKQKEACDFFESRQRQNINTIDTSSVGTGKTVVAAHLVKALGGEVAVICPKSVIPSWERELEETGIKPLFVLNYENIRRGRPPYMTKKGKKIMASAQKHYSPCR